MVMEMSDNTGQGQVSKICIKSKKILNSSSMSMKSQGILFNWNFTRFLMSFFLMDNAMS